MNEATTTYDANTYSRTVSRYMWRDQAYLLDMLTAARDARDFAAGLTRDGYEASRLAQYAVSHARQIIGEAAARVSDDTRNSVGDVPWAQLIGLRNRLVHDYGRIDRDILWDTLQVDISSLIDQLERLVSSDQGE